MSLRMTNPQTSQDKGLNYSLGAYKVNIEKIIVKTSEANH